MRLGNLAIATSILVALTVLTQIGGIAYLFARGFMARRRLRPSPTVTATLTLAVYAFATLVAVPPRSSAGCGSHVRQPRWSAVC